MKMTGGCQCRQVRYEVASPPLELYVCHCRECQAQSASAFGISVIVRSTDVRVLQGELKRWSRPADSGRTIDYFFCPNCGTRVFGGDKDRSDTISVKGGSLDAAPDLSAAVHIWTSRKMPGVVIPDGAPQYPGEPDE